MKVNGCAVFMIQRICCLFQVSSQSLEVLVIKVVPAAGILNKSHVVLRFSRQLAIDFEVQVVESLRLKLRTDAS